MRRIDSQRAVVVGAGLAGLASAHALHQLGYDVRILERDDRLRAEGAGLTLWPNAVRALRDLGLGCVVDTATVPIAEAVTLRPNGSTIARVPLERLVPRFGPFVAAHRAELLAALAEQVAGAIEFDANVSYDRHSLLVGREPLEADLVVGADGIGSAVREAVASGVQPRPAGYAAWRGVARIGEGVVSRASETMGRGRRFGLVPLRDGRVYWFAVAAGGGADLDLQTVFASWHAPIADVLHATPRDERSYLPLHDLPKLPRWHSGSVVLAGDAAHAMTPNLGQGAAQAFEDVAVLARELDARPLPDALVAYEGARKRRAERIVRQSRFFGRVAQTTNPVLVWARDFAAARTPVALAERQFASILDPA